MKALFHILTLFLFIFKLHAQGNSNQQNHTYVHKMDSLLEYVDKRPISTGILYDRVMPFARLSEFDPAKDSSDFEHFRQAWSELHRASYEPHFPAWTELEEQLDQSIAYDEVCLGIIHARFHHLDMGTESRPNLKLENGRFRNIPDRQPFAEKEIVLVSPLKRQVWGQTIKFRFSGEFLLDLAGQPIDQLEVDPGNGQWTSVMENGQLITHLLEVEYDRPGKHLLRFRATLPDGSSLSTQSSLQVSFQPTSTTLSVGGAIETQEITALIPFKGYNEPVAIRGKSKYRIYYNTKGGNTQPILKKPILIIDGFDPLDERQIEASDPGHNPNDEPDFPSIYELMAYGGNNLVETLRLQGYDVVIVNHHKYEANENGQVIVGGGDYIERNAMVLIRLIQTLNTRLQAAGSSEKLVIIGPSMGGLISRYALAYMEKNNLPHNTRLWVSFDSPHLGANIPISVHQTLDFFGNAGGDEKSKETLNKKLRSVAAKQMLIEQLGKMNNSEPFRQQFLTNVNSNGLSGSGHLTKH